MSARSWLKLKALQATPQSLIDRLMAPSAPDDRETTVDEQRRAVLKGMGAAGAGAPALFDTGWLDDFDLDFDLDIFEAPKLEVVRSLSDLPDPRDGRIHLKDDTSYLFLAHVVGEPTLDHGEASAILGIHGGVSGYHHTGEDVAVRARDTHSLVKDMTITAPNGQYFDLRATESRDGKGREHYWKDVSTRDFLGLGTADSVGRIEGFRNQILKDVNLENADQGLTLTGSTQKTLIADSPLRYIEGNSPTVVEFDRDYDGRIVHMTGNYVKQLPSNAKVVRVDGRATITDVFLYESNTHDTSVSVDDILNGQVGVGEVGTQVSTSYPLRISGVAGDIRLDSSGTVTGSGSGPVQIGSQNVSTAEAGSVSLERMEQSSNGVLKYIGQAREKTDVQSTVTVSGSNTEFMVSLAKNGSQISGVQTRGFLANNSSPQTVPLVGTVRFETDDTVSVELENVGGASDLTVEQFSLVV